MFKSIFRMLVIVFALSVHTSYANEDNEVMFASCPSEVAEQFDSLIQRFMLAFFGGEASVEFLGANIDESKSAIIKSMTTQEAQACASPFPAESYKGVKGTLNALYAVTMGVWMVMIGMYTFANTYSKQNSGDSEQDDEGLVMKLARSTSLMLLLTPVAGFVSSAVVSDDSDDKSDIDLSMAEYSPLHNLLFSIIGTSIDVAEDIDKTFKSKHGIQNPKYIIPNPNFPVKKASNIGFTSEQESQDGTLLFAACVMGISDGSRINVSDLEVNFSDRDEHLAVFKYQHCQVKLTMNIDNSTPMAISAMKKLQNIDVGINYAKLEIETFRSLTETLMDISLGFYYGLYNNVLQRNPDNLTVDRLSENDALVEMKIWHDKCESTFDGGVELSKEAIRSDGKVDALSVHYAKILATYCIGKAITEKLSYPRNSNDEFDFDTASLGDKLPLSGRLYQACSFASIDGNATDYKSCVKTVCENIEPQENASGLFECAVLSSVSRLNLLTTYYDKLGFIATPAMMLTRLGDGTIPMTPQSLLTSFNIDYTSNFLAFYGSGNIARLNSKLMSSERDNDSLVLPEFVEFEYNGAATKGGNAGVLESALQCFANPNTVVKTYSGDIISCGHPITEFHNLGMDILKIYAGFITGTFIKTGLEMSVQGTSRVKKFIIDGKISDGKKAKAVALGKVTEKVGKDWLSDKLKSALVKASAMGLGIGMGYLIEGSLASASGLDSFMLDGEVMPYTINKTSSMFSGMPAGAAVILGYMMGGQINDKSGDFKAGKYNDASAKVNRNISFISVTLLTVGVIFAFVIPLAPAAIFYTALISIFANIIALVFSATFHMIYALAGTGKDVKKKLLELLNKWLLVLLRLPLLVVGFYLAYALMNTVLPDLAVAVGEIVNLNVKGSSGFDTISGAIKGLISLITFCIVILFVLYALFDSITGPFSITRDLVFSDDSGEAMGKTDSAAQVKDNMNVFKSIG